MPDLPFIPHDAARAERVAAAFDREGKVLRALETFGPVSGQRVVLLGLAPALARALAGVAAHVTEGDPTDLPRAGADVAVAPWIGFDGEADEADLAAADRILSPGGRLLLLQDYGRDDLTAVRGRARTDHLVGRSRRDGWLLRAGFRVHVIHAWWRFSDLAEAADLLEGAFGPAAGTVVAALRRPVVAHNVAVYHRTAAGS